ncbi:MAG: hypothetical protein E6R08_10235 [Nevskiaceae bacterium]|nr:MAG: hypothetical protein E6R08_10235 [Nevskiaceae bacterium]
MNNTAEKHNEGCKPWRITRRVAGRAEVTPRCRDFLTTPTSAKKIARLDGAVAERLTSHGHVTARLRFTALTGRWMPESVAIAIGA